jgi:hypothetical protein
MFTSDLQLLATTFSRYELNQRLKILKKAKPRIDIHFIILKVEVGIIPNQNKVHGNAHCVPLQMVES